MIKKSGTLTNAGAIPPHLKGKKKKKNKQNKTSKNGKKERRGEEREEKGRSNSDYSFERKTVLTCARDKLTVFFETKQHKGGFIIKDNLGYYM